MSAFWDAALANWRECRADFELDLYARYVRAEAECNGVMLNARGVARDVDPLSLFMGPAVRAFAYASDELLEHWLTWPRVTYAQFEAQWSARSREDVGW